MKKMFYFMNVDINWIKQRPHFIAEQLNEKYDMTIYYPIFYNKKVLTNNKFGKNIKFKKIFRLPNVFEFKILRSLINFIMGISVKININIKKPEILFFSSPDHINYIPKKYNGTIIYDCMDDLVALARTSEQKKRVYKNEEKLISNSDIVLVTSNELKKVISCKYKNVIDKKRIELCRNAFNGVIIDDKKIIDKKSDNIFKIGYFGTVSTWFDFKKIENSLKLISNLEYHIFGPIVDGVNIPQNNRIKYHGIIEHDNMINFALEMDCLIMPFEINDITKSVDPVKLYEYINFNKNILSIYYDEIQRFSPFVYFYNNEEELISNIKQLITDNSKKYSNIERITFLQMNSWENRCKQIECILEGKNE